MIALSFALLPLALLLGDGPALGLLGLLSAPLALGPARAVQESTDGPALNAALAGTGALLGAFALLVSIGLVL
jgi:1,4-dihydroxy-2-naphthoate octaprenyltransferase